MRKFVYFFHLNYCTYEHCATTATTNSATVLWGRKVLALADWLPICTVRMEWPKYAYLAAGGRLHQSLNHLPLVAAFDFLLAGSR